MLAVPEEGQGLVEYALIIFLIALVLMITLTLMGNALVSYYSSITAAIAT